MKIVSCPNGHTYDARAEANCGICRRLPTVETGQFDRAGLRVEEFERRKAVEREDAERRTRALHAGFRITPETLRAIRAPGGGIDLRLEGSR